MRRCLRLTEEDRLVDLVLHLTTRTNRLEDQQTSVLFEANTGGTIPLFGKEAFDMAQPAPLTLAQAGEGRGEQKAAAHSHETQLMKGIEDPVSGTWRRK